MRLVVDTNILISALLIETSLPARLILLWRQGQFDLVSSAERLDELMRVTRYPKVRERLNPALAGRGCEPRLAQIAKACWARLITASLSLSASS